MPMHQKREVKAKVLTSKKNMAALSQQEKILFALDLSSYDWLNFPHWEKAVDMNDFSNFLLWLTDQDAILAGIVATKQEEFLAVFEKVKSELLSVTKEES